MQAKNTTDRKFNMKTMLAVIPVALSSTAMAQAQPTVYDSKSVLVGTLLGDYEVIVQRNGKAYSLEMYQGQLVPDVWLLFKGANCAGSPYVYSRIDYDVPYEYSVLPLAQYQALPLPGSTINKVIWAPDGSVPQSTMVQSLWHEEIDTKTGMTNGSCDNFAATSGVLSPAVAIDTTSKGFAPPFCVSLTGNSCADPKVAKR